MISPFVFTTHTNCKGNYKANAFARTIESGRTARNCKIHIDNLTVQQTLRIGFDDFTTGEYTYIYTIQLCTYTRIHLWRVCMVKIDNNNIRCACSYISFDAVSLCS